MFDRAWYRAVISSGLHRRPAIFTTLLLFVIICYLVCDLYSVLGARMLIEQHA